MAGGASQQAQDSLASGYSQVKAICEKGKEMASNTTQKAQKILEKRNDGAKGIVWGEKGEKK